MSHIQIRVSEAQLKKLAHGQSIRLKNNDFSPPKEHVDHPTSAVLAGSALKNAASAWKNDKGFTLHPTDVCGGGFFSVLGSIIKGVINVAPKAWDLGKAIYNEVTGGEVNHHVDSDETLWSSKSGGATAATAAGVSAIPWKAHTTAHVEKSIWSKKQKHVGLKKQKHARVNKLKVPWFEQEAGRV